MIIGINVVDLCYAKEKWFNEQSNPASYGKIMEYLLKISIFIKTKFAYYLRKELNDM